MSKGKNFTVRLSEGDQQRLTQLAHHLDTNRSATIRQAVQIAWQTRPISLEAGVFTSANTAHPLFVIRVAERDT
ncbi:MAG: hypothetical protein AAFN11_04895 [Chloroflexota bacterium]